MQFYLITNYLVWESVYTIQITCKVGLVSTSFKVELFEGSNAQLLDSAYWSGGEGVGVCVCVCVCLTYKRVS